MAWQRFGGNNGYETGMAGGWINTDTGQFSATEPPEWKAQQSAMFRSPQEEQAFRARFGDSSIATGGRGPMAITAEGYNIPISLEDYSRQDMVRSTENSRGTLMDQFMFDYFPMLWAGGAAGTAMGAASAGTTGATTTGLESGAPMMSTPASTGSTGLFGTGAPVSTPAMTTMAGPTGTGMLSSSVPTSSLGAGAAGGAAGATLTNTGNATTNPNFNYNPGGGVESVPIENAGQGATFAPQPTANIANAGPGATSAPAQQPIISNYGSSWLEQMGGMKDVVGMGRDALQLGGGLYSLANAEDMEDSMDAQMKAMQAQQGPRYPNEMNWDLVNGYLRDPMSVLRNNPGYLASVDFVEKEGRRQMAKGGYNVSGNKTHYLADVLGKNAQNWYEKAWAPIRDAAGLMKDTNAAAIGQVGVNAEGQINQAKQNAVGDLFNAGARALPSIFKFALG